MVLSFYNFHERSEFTSSFTSILTSESRIILFVLSPAKVRIKSDTSTC